LAVKRNLEHGPLAAVIGPCTCRPKDLRLRSNHGELVHPRGGLVNHCERCAMMAGYENMEMLLLDSLEGDPPTGLLIFGARTATLDMGAYREARRQVARALRREFPDFEYARLTEFTTGHGPKSGGLRRSHDNVMTKGIPAERMSDALEISAAVWCRHVDAEVHAQYGEAMRTPSAALKYVIGHFGKDSQRPPAGFEGQRFGVSRCYFSVPVKVMRARAREIQARKRETWKLEQLGRGGHDLVLDVELALRRQAATIWTPATTSGARLGKDVLPDEGLVDRLRNAGRRSLDAQLLDELAGEYS